MNEQLKSALRISLSVNILFEKLSNKRAGGSVHEKKKLVLSPQALLNQLRAVFDQIIELQNTQDAIYRAALEELQRRLRFEEKKQQRGAEVWFWCWWLIRFDSELVLPRSPARQTLPLRLWS